jgi:hypothetical protein
MGDDDESKLTLLTTKLATAAVSTRSTRILTFISWLGGRAVSVPRNEVG